jgi:hypothetical protein
MKMRLKVLAALGAVALIAGIAACVPQTTTTTPTAGGTSDAACAATGGKMVTGLAGPVCAKVTKDAGKACTSNDQCETNCLAETKTCAPTSPYFGCFATLENGVETPMMCVD